MKVTPLTSSDVELVVIMRMESNKAAGTDQLQAENFRYRGNEIKKSDGNCYQIVRGRKKAVKMDKRDYLSIV
jgi:hypothetical protein